MGTDATSDIGCKTARVTFYEAGTWAVRGKILWLHTLPRFENVNTIIHGDNTWAHLDAGHMADTVTSDFCPMSGPHVHETFEMVSNRNTSFYPTSATCRWPVVTTDCDNFQNNLIQHWTMSILW